MFYWKYTKTYVKLKKYFEGYSTLNLIVRKYSGSHHKLRPASAEYELNDG